MREIKFRGKDISTGKWLYGSYIYQPVFACCFPQDGRTPPKETATRIYLPETFDDAAKICSVDPTTVGQYTGLKDKNGVEIYEGDIVCIWSGCTGVVRIGTYNDDFLEYSPTICGVYCNEIGGANHNFGLTQYFTNEAEVVGNVHDAPELLGDESELLGDESELLGDESPC